MARNMALRDAMSKHSTNRKEKSPKMANGNKSSKFSELDPIRKDPNGRKSVHFTKILTNGVFEKHRATYMGKPNNRQFHLSTKVVK
jgi:hypothetical protein